MMSSSKILRGCTSGLCHAFQFTCRVAMGLIVLLIVFGVIWGSCWRRNEGGEGWIQSGHKVQRIGLAMLNFATAHKTFPPAYSAGKDGTPLLSWRVLILPYMGQDSLYQEFRLDEPWDSEHNKRLISKMPNEYRSPISKRSDEGKTNYLTVRGEKTLFPGDKGVAFQDVPDGMSNMIMTVEVSDDRAVIWTKPGDLEYDEQHPLKGLGMWNDYFLVGMADGSMQSLPASIDPRTLKALFTRKGSGRVDADKLDKQPAN